MRIGVVPTPLALALQYVAPGAPAVPEHGDPSEVVQVQVFMVPSTQASRSVTVPVPLAFAAHTDATAVAVEATVNVACGRCVADPAAFVQVSIVSVPAGDAAESDVQETVPTADHGAWIALPTHVVSVCRA